jgi:uncharacterized protein (TIGR03086 family)
MRDVAGRYVGAIDEVDRHVRAIGPDRWSAPTPCSAWDLRALVDHLVYETLWVPDLLAGRTLAEVGSRYEGDRLGSDPVAAWVVAHAAAVAAARSPSAEVVVHTSGGELTVDEYLAQMLFDASIHGWDVAQAIGVEHTIPDEVAADLLEWFEPQARGWVAAGMLAAGVPVDAGADAATRLIALAGRDPADPIGPRAQSGAGQPGP